VTSSANSPSLNLLHTVSIKLLCNSNNPLFFRKLVFSASFWKTFYQTYFYFSTPLVWSEKVSTYQSTISAFIQLIFNSFCAHFLFNDDEPCWRMGHIFVTLTHSLFYHTRTHFQTHTFPHTNTHFISHSHPHLTHWHTHLLCHCLLCNPPRTHTQSLFTTLFN